MVQDHQNMVVLEEILHLHLIVLLMLQMVVEEVVVMVLILVDSLVLVMDLVEEQLVHL